MANKKYVNDYGGVDPLLRRLCAHPILTAKQERRLLERYHNFGDLEARAQLITCNQKLILRVIRQRVPSGIIAQVGMRDLVQDGNIGLALAVDGFSLKRKTRLSTYASWWIRSYVQRGSMEKARVVGVNHRKAREHRSAVRRHSQEVAATGQSTAGEAVSYEDMAIIRGLARTVDIDARVTDPNGGDSMSLSDILDSGAESIEETVCRDDLCLSVRKRLEEFRNELPDPRLWEIIARRLMATDGDAETLQQLGKEFGVSRERVRQLESKLISRLRECLADLV